MDAGSQRPKSLTPEDVFWCELALALGGRTVAELKASMSAREVDTWVRYRAEYGVNQMRAIEFGSALVAQSMRGGKFEDYLPQRGTPAPPAAVTPEQAMALMPGKVIRRG